ncbi:hypothetical protein SBA4_4040009 [Candidatus Sulfopaludibacter sp. SbA4]|nr:hypothetical protein SBA4_4040009 [Candidatus Sulfopaludibacter sp. SbA4]
MDRAQVEKTGHARHDASHLIFWDLSGAPGQIRTADLLVRSQTLYPTELRALAGNLTPLMYPTPHPFRNFLLPQ